ncbi:MAG: DUF4388 domain-containing protein [Pyrinomonadaceae bacterium]
MQEGRFVVLTGRLSEYALGELVGILRRQRKTGRLLIEYAIGPASFYFQEGEVVDVRLNGLTGLQAICVAVAQPDASFNFNPLIKPLHRSIDNSFQRVVSELLGCWDESALEIDAAPVHLGPVPNMPPSAVGETKSIEPPAHEMLALPAYAGANSWMRGRLTLLVAVAALMTLGISTVIALSSGLRGSPPNATAMPVSEKASALTQAAADDPVSLKVSTRRESSESARARADRPAPRDEKKPPKVEDKSKDGQPANASDGSSESAAVESVEVVMKIENGQVQQASIANHKPGMDNYEALALRMARQRRYAGKVNGQETVKVRVIKPE